LLVFLIGMAMGVEIPAGAAAVLLLLGIAVGTGAAVALACITLAFRLRTQQTGMLMQALVLTVFLLSNALVPTDLMRGWLRTIAEVNPMSLVLDTARAGFVGEIHPGPVFAGSGAVLAAIVIAWWAAVRSIRREVVC
jgi:ABC-2 type transport system permease protein